MIKSTKNSIVKATIEKVWEIITDNTNYSWRSDLSKIEIIDDHHFIEYTKGNFVTNFKITKKEMFKRYEFDIENENLKGHFTAMLKELSEDETQVVLIEEIRVDSFFMKLLAKPYLRKQQNRYIKDLIEKLENKRY